MADLSVEVAGIRFRNPVLPAAGPPGRDGRALEKCADGGAGGLVAKTISVTAARPPIPNMAEIHHGMVNTELWSELPPERWLEVEYPIARAVARAHDLPLIASLGYSADDIARLPVPEYAVLASRSFLGNLRLRHTFCACELEDLRAIRFAAPNLLTEGSFLCGVKGETLRTSNAYPGHAVLRHRTLPDYPHQFNAAVPPILPKRIVFVQQELRVGSLSTVRERFDFWGRFFP